MDHTLDNQSVFDQVVDIHDGFSCTRIGTAALAQPRDFGIGEIPMYFSQVEDSLSIQTQVAQTRSTSTVPAHRLGSL